MASLPNVAVLAFYVAGGCAKILVPLLYFLARPSPRNPVIDEAAIFLLVALPTAYLAGVVLAYLHLAAPLPATAQASAAAVSFADLARFVVLVFTLVSSCLLLIAVPVAAFFYLAAGKRGTGQGFS